ncbi:MAG: hypothetical protein A3B23_02725 [Candidatus Colwellbacteria bacterium RIFCSPLOWO2_01_FULL_48_10]|uniref:Phosphatidic acid phosphatase type 2/haloperoxidase domain-containing protein n=1 Tax=Candidatus Colwellbacteria bacterium RIFCSPLOWO2_01_FULL_48_10 TaxID=1797690 RepID=A0A1G1Z3L7_9BACT|nr:MAG: hypothetical protein A3B23_02725 [Candidatus Colwellbacteria bacterium RIFCSPLOWO2_01_FULL_48_10]
MNHALFEFLHGLAHQNAFLDWIFVFFAKYLLYIMVVGFIYILFAENNWPRRWYYSVLATLALIISAGIVSPIVRYFYASPRPFVALLDVTALVAHVNNSSLPSGHMMFAAPLALAAYYLNNRVGRWFLVGAALMGVSRVIAGVHWPLDIITGLVLGAASFYLARFILKKGGVEDKALIEAAPVL